MVPVLQNFEHAGHGEITWIACKMDLNIVVLGKSLSPLQCVDEGTKQILLSNVGAWALHSCL